MTLRSNLVSYMEGRTLKIFRILWYRQGNLFKKVILTSYISETNTPNFCLLGFSFFLDHFAEIGLFIVDYA